MADATGAGGYYPPGGAYGPGYGPGYGMTISDRIQRCVGRVITVYVGEENVPVAGMLHAVGPDYLELHRMADTTTTGATGEMVLIPLHQVQSIVIPVQAHPGMTPPPAAPGR